MVIKSHPTCDKLIEQFKAEQREVEKLAIQLMVDGPSEPKKSKEKRIYDILKYVHVLLFEWIIKISNGD